MHIFICVFLIIKQDKNPKEVGHHGYVSEKKLATGDIFLRRSYNIHLPNVGINTSWELVQKIIQVSRSQCQGQRSGMLRNVILSISWC